MATSKGAVTELGYTLKVTGRTTDAALPPKFVRVIWTDAAGLRRARLVPYSQWESLVARGVGLGVTQACMAMPAWGDVVAPGSGLGPSGEVRLLPSGEGLTVSRVPWHEGHAFVLAKMLTAPGVPWECCPHAALSRMVASFCSELGIELLMGFESEFVLLDAAKLKDGAAPATATVDTSLYSMAGALDACAGLLDEMAAAIDQASGVRVQLMHAESAPGQFEVVTSPADPLTAVEGLVLTREAIAGVARRAGRVATFLPKLANHRAGSGCHMHLSLWKVENDGSKTSLMGDGNEVPKQAAAFMAGVLAHLPGLCCFTLPAPISYMRLLPGAWAGAFQTWGRGARESAVRLCSTPGEADATNVEFKTMDCTANPYIAATAILAAGLAGIHAGLQLPEPAEVDPATLEPEARAQRGWNRLPQTLPNALAAFESNAELKDALAEALGEPLLTALLAVRQSEAKHFENMSLLQQVGALYDRY